MYGVEEDIARVFTFCFKREEALRRTETRRCGYYQFSSIETVEHKLIDTDIVNERNELLL